MGKPSIERATHLKEVKVPMLFLQGTRDALAANDLIESVCSALPTATLVKIEGADHAFKAGKKDVMKILVENTKDWLSGRSNPKSQHYKNNEKKQYTDNNLFMLYKFLP